MKTMTRLTCLLAALLIPAITHAESPGGKRQVDSDGDGKVSRAEAEAASAKKLLKRFDKIDTDGDGYITKVERKAAREQAGEKMKEGKEKGKGKIKAADTDGNGALSRDEANAAGMTKMVEHFDKIDADGDGEISKEEMKASREQLRERRKDGTGPGKGEKPGDA